MLKVYNSLSKEKEVFEPLKEKEVTMYVCGPTVYNDIHIGNARSMVAFDTIRRYLELVGYNVKYVSNFTDVDDKIIKRANELGVSTKDIAEKYINSVLEDMKSLNIKEAMLNPKATNYIDSMISMIQNLIDQDYAYIASNGDVYFRIKKFKKYGELSHQKLDDLYVGASKRVDDNEASFKEDPLDFVLWKHAKDGEVNWQASFGNGRPGWHIECSAMIKKIFGSTIDIHAGGQDLTFPHHENERAQSECVTGEKFANYWLHNGYVTVGNEKMSKSLGNFTTVKELLKRKDAEVIRFFMASAHYRKPLQFDEEGLKEAEINLNKIKEAYNYADFREKDAVAKGDIGIDITQEYYQKFIQSMNDDFNVQNALSIIYDFAKWINEYSRQDEVSKETIIEIKEKLNMMLGVYGINLNNEEIDDTWILEMIEKRNEARKNKDYALSDKIRDELKEKGIILEDTRQGTKYKKV